MPETTLTEDGTASKRIRVVLVDDHAVMREGTRALMEKEEDIEVVGEAASANGGLDAVLTHQPDVLVLDIRLKDGSGVDLAKAVRQQAPDTRILVLTAYDNDQYVRALVRIGVNGYLLKDAPAAEVNAAIRTVFQGGTVLAPDIATKVVKTLSRALGGRPTEGDKLSDREIEVLGLLLSGARNSDIAEQLGVNVKTAESHVTSILTKLGVQTRMQAVLKAIQEGLIKVPA